MQTLFVLAYGRERQSQKRGTTKDPAIVARESDCLVRQQRTRLTDRSGGKNHPAEDAPRGTAVLLLHFHGVDGDLVQMMVDDRETQMVLLECMSQNKPLISCLPPVPKNWVPPCGPFPRDLEAIE